MTDAVALLSRVMLSAIFVWGGFEKLMAADATQAYFAKAGLPMPQAAYGVAVLVELGVGLALLLGLLTRASALVLAVWCLATAAVAHSNLADHAALIQLYKNVAICGGMLSVVAYGGGNLSVDALFRRTPAHAL